MKNNVDIEELDAMIPSATVRDYVLDKGWTFTDREKACLLMCYNDLPLKELYSRLRDLRDNTDDNILKEKLTQYLDSEDKGIRELKENDDRRYIYVLKMRDSADRDDYVVGYFSDYEIAYEHGINDREIYSFTIEKYLIYEAHVLKQGDEEWYNDCAVSSIYFVNGEAYDFSNYCHSDYDGNYFWPYFEVPNPFEGGDIVKIHETYGIVNTSQKAWKEDLERFSPSKNPDSNSDFSDILIHVAIPDSDGIFRYYDHISPLELERYQPKPSCEGGSALDDILLEASKIYKGEGYLDSLYYFAEQYKKAVNSKK